MVGRFPEGSRAVSPGARETLLAIGCLMVCFLPGLLGSRFQPGAWYESLAKPALTPPGWVFPVTWTALYLMMGVALFLVARQHATANGFPLAVSVFASQLLLNALWSWFFFGLQRPALAFLDIVALWFLILASVLLFWRISTVASMLLLPYLVWVGFATWLNFAFWRLNHG